MNRTHNCGELRIENIDQRVILEGWLSSIRDLGSMIFLTLRDYYGVTQIFINNDEQMTFVRDIPRESTISISGIVKRRTNPNESISTGLIEIIPEDVRIINKCQEQLPFEIANSTDSREDTRLKYRFLDLRNPINKEKIKLRSDIIYSMREEMVKKGFLEIQTPILTNSSPEGARDYLVPSRVHKGKFYALPQAPQQFKQLLMLSGFDKYFQIAPCFRDEDARADRSPGEFYQLDMEMAFASQEDVFDVMEEVLFNIFTKYSNWAACKPPFTRITFKDAMDKYGSDKPDLRNPLLLTDATELFKEMNISFIKEKFVKAIKVNNCMESRRFFDEVAAVSQENGGSIAWINYRNATISGSITKFIDEKNINKLNDQFNLQENTSIIFIFGDNYTKNCKISGLLRNYIGNKLNLIEKNTFKFCWIVDFPMFERNEDTGKTEFSHNPFSMPQGGLDSLITKDPLDVLAYQYDIVCNGIELSSGAVRNHDISIMVKAFEIAGYDEDVIMNKFPALYNAFKFGAPPHAGVAPGIDRIVMLIANEPNIREVIAFPMNKSAQDLLMNAPNTVSEQQLADVHITLK